jgi:hypothetical protein
MSWKFPAAIIVKTFVPAILLLGGCASTTVTGSSDPSGAPASAWADYDRLPVELHGTVQGHTKAELAALFPADHRPEYAVLGDLPPAPGRRMVLYVNPAQMPPQSELCSNSHAFRRGPQAGGSAFATGALCDGPKVISVASAYVLTRDQSPQGLAYNFSSVRDQLYLSLFPGATDPDRYFN